MPPGDEGSITRWIVELKAGDPDAAEALWRRYFARLVGLARARLAATRRPGADADEEDAALSAFGSFCDGAARGRFPILGDRDDLWRLLVVLTSRKVSAQVQRRGALKRGGGAAAQTLPIEEMAGGEPTPEFAAMVAEEFRRLLERLGDPELRQVAVMKMEGYTNDEVAAHLGCARRTVARRLEMIRRLWTEESP